MGCRARFACGGLNGFSTITLMHTGNHYCQTGSRRLPYFNSNMKAGRFVSWGLTDVLAAVLNENKCAGAPAPDM